MERGGCKGGGEEWLGATRVEEGGGEGEGVLRGSREPYSFRDSCLKRSRGKQSESVKPAV